jgi:two-component system, sensor histidine kinase PdtaS
MAYRLRRHDGVYRWVLDNGSPFQRNGKFAGYFGSCIDVTEQREAHDRLVAMIAQRDALISEVYHRVKNNLQQIEGLIAIESTALADGASITALQSVSSRVRAMGAVHQMLMKSKSLAHIRADAFLGELCEDIARANAAEQRGISIEVEAAPRDLDIDRALVIGLMVNELATNALKHAFPDGRSGSVRVRFDGAGAGAVLEVADDGVGIPEGAFDTASQRSGFRLVKGFADQLNGQLAVERGPGAVVRVVLP